MEAKQDKMLCSKQCQMLSTTLTIWHILVCWG